ncbi:phosphoribosylanthranilate isomerase [Arthrobacter sulfonylureivorans]|uniref:N-(5'-phosphoribosyl)anthranilate isomerase n=1 Tax=Arthrobacter sulfonylureivorans TaxID=2486855 RepID=A0ABY3WBF6_9MICC|nr:phosphoribosylanthranilate isomerase [Arthrobacter sulfonylureivorans]UNK47683.1 phosphoribosylanthranilate isomerase [Arthrobacter sulfonylureivorans]
MVADTYVKICGLRTPEAVAAAVDAGADAVGFVFAPGGPRTVSATLARSLGEAVPAGVETVGVFRNQPIGEVIETARAAAVTTVQLHGDEPLADIRMLEGAGFRTLRAFSADAYSALPADEKAGWETGRILLDAVEPGAGVTFDASAIQAQPPRGFWLLAGGLTPANVGTLIATLRPNGVDVSSGVESSRGVKDIGLIRDFVHAAKM